MTGVGVSNDWKAISEKLKTLDAQQERLAISTMPADTEESFKIIVLDDEISVFYSDGKGPAKGVSVGPGNLVFKLRATAVGGQRGVCKLSITPAFEPFEALGRKALAIKQYKEFVFEQLGIEAELGPGDFVVFAPASYAADDATITSTIFQKPGLTSAVQFFVFVCTGVAD